MAILKQKIDGVWTEVPICNLNVDSVLSDTSENPVQNKAIKNYVDSAVASSNVGKQVIVQNDEPTSAEENDLWLDLDEEPAEALSLAGGTLTGPLAMSNNKITGLATPTSSNDAVNKTYVDSNYLPLSGGTLNGSLTVQDGLTINDSSVPAAIILKASAHGLPYIDGEVTPVDNNEFVQKGYVDSELAGKEATSATSSATGTITVTLADHYDYSFTEVTSLTLTAGIGSCHGFITFDSSTPTVSLSGFTKVDGDIANAAASTVWEFSCYNKYAVFKNWSEV